MMGNCAIIIWKKSEKGLKLKVKEPNFMCKMPCKPQWTRVVEKPVVCILTLLSPQGVTTITVHHCWTPDTWLPGHIDQDNRTPRTPGDLETQTKKETKITKIPKFGDRGGWGNK